MVVVVGIMLLLYDCYALLSVLCNLMLITTVIVAAAAVTTITITITSTARYYTIIIKLLGFFCQ